MLRRKRLAGLITLTMLAPAGGALAQNAPPPNPRQACRSSAISLCHPEISAHDMAGVRACLVRNFDKVTPDCQAAMKAVRDGQAADPDAPPTPGSAAPQQSGPPPSSSPHR